MNALELKQDAPILVNHPNAEASQGRIVIGFGFQARRGKDTAVDAIVLARGKEYKIRRYGFADALRREIEDSSFRVGGLRKLCELVGVPFDPDAIPDAQNPEGKQRALLQFWGTEYRRLKFGQDYWVKRVAAQIEKDKPDVALISDMRFLNEFAWVKDQPRGFTVRMERRGFETSTPIAAHISESELAALSASDWSATISASDGDLDHVRNSAVQLFDLLVA